MEQLNKKELVALKELLERHDTVAVLERWPHLAPLQVIQAVGTSILEQVRIPTDVPKVTLSWLEQIAENIAPTTEEEEDVSLKRQREGGEVVALPEEEEEQEQEIDGGEGLREPESKRKKKTMVDLSDLLDMCRRCCVEDTDNRLTAELAEARSRYMLNMSPYRRDFVTLLAMGWFSHTFRKCSPAETLLRRDVAAWMFIGSRKPSSDKRLRQAETLYELIAVHGMHRLRHLQPQKGTVAALCNAPKADLIEQLRDQEDEWAEQDLDFGNIRWIPQ